MQTTTFRRALCALAAGVLLVLSASALTTQAATASARPLGDPSSLTRSDSLNSLAESHSGTATAGGEVRIRGEARVGSQLTATATGELFETGDVSFEWLIERPAPTPEPTSTATPTATPTPWPTPTPSSTPTAPPALLPPPAPTAEYTVLPADLGHVIRVRATVTRPNTEAVSRLSAPTAAVEAALPTPTPTPTATPTTPPGSGGTPTESPSLPTTSPTAPAVPAQGGSRWADDEAVADAAEAPVVADGAGPTASAPFVNVTVPSDVLLIGGLAALAVVAGIAIFGRHES